MIVSIIDYGMGNIYSLKAAIKKLRPEAEVRYTNDKKDLSISDKLFLPGVGNFRIAMDKINDLNLKELIRMEVLEKKKPIMGICLGMQLLFDYGTEGGGIEGLGLVPGNVDQFIKIGGLKIPHMGFNTVKSIGNSTLFSGLKHHDFYFVHSYRIKDLTEKTTSHGVTSYGEDFISTVELNNICGTQFHPEKSQSNGLKVISNFLNKESW